VGGTLSCRLGLGATIGRRAYCVHQCQALGPLEKKDNIERKKENNLAGKNSCDDLTEKRKISEESKLLFRGKMRRNRKEQKKSGDSKQPRRRKLRIL
jgi:hypothetical protein